MYIACTKPNFMHTKTTLIWVCAGLLALGSCQKAADCPEPEPQTVDLVTRGAYIVATSGCNDCHTPKTMTDHGPVPDMNRMLSGHPASEAIAPYDPATVGPWVLLSPGLTAAVGPWGVTYAANLTPSESGLKGWNEERFMKAIREGKHMGLDNTRPIMPPMPWQEISKMTDDDLKAMFAYLQTIPAVDNVVPAFAPAAH